ncbi:MAG: hypothetical protein K1Y01_18355 [Vicinamibacteria bacterium]|nr:hypothetical protein [Vicinamibacteria bacterium]
MPFQIVASGGIIVNPKPSTPNTVEFLIMGGRHRACLTAPREAITVRQAWFREECIFRQSDGTELVALDLEGCHLTCGSGGVTVLDLTGIISVEDFVSTPPVPSAVTAMLDKNVSSRTGVAAVCVVGAGSVTPGRLSKHQFQTSGGVAFQPAKEAVITIPDGAELVVRSGTGGEVRMTIAAGAVCQLNALCGWTGANEPDEADFDDAARLLPLAKFKPLNVADGGAHHPGTDICLLKRIR